MLDAAALLAMGLALLERGVFIIPGDKDGIDVAFGPRDCVGSTLEDHILGVAADAIAWEENLNAMAGLEGIAVADKGIAGVDRDGLSNFDRHIEK